MKKSVKADGSGGKGIWKVTQISSCHPRDSNFKTACQVSEFAWDNSGLETKYRLTGYQRDFLKEFVRLVCPFETTFLKLQRNKRAAISEVIPFFMVCELVGRCTLKNQTSCSLMRMICSQNCVPGLMDLTTTTNYTWLQLSWTVDLNYAGVEVRWFRQGREGEEAHAKVDEEQEFRRKRDSATTINKFDDTACHAAFLDMFPVAQIQTATDIFRVTADAELQLYIDDTQCFEAPLDCFQSSAKSGTLQATDLHSAANI